MSEKYTIDNAKNDIQNLQSQNSYDFQEIKRLDGLINDYEKRVLQAINFNNQINKKIQCDYENLKKTALDRIKQLEEWLSTGSDGSGLTITQTNQLNEAYTHSQSYHISKQEIPTKTSQLINDSDFVNSSYVNNAISNVTGDNSQLWSGKEASFLGDSITYGVRTTKKYHDYLKEYLGFGKVNNYGIDGSSVTSHSNGMCTRYSNISNTSDIIFIFGGTNDFYYGKVLGEWYTVSGNTRTLNTDTTTFKGALVTICKGLINKFPDKQIVLMTPIHRSKFQNQITDLQSNSQNLFLENYVDVIKECGKIFSIPVIDLYSESGLYPADENNANLYFNTSIPDLLHPNANGHERIAQLIASKVKLLQPTTSTNTTIVYGDIVLNTTSLSINEKNTGTFKVKLDKQPTNNQIVNLSINNQYCTLSTTSLTFTTSNYSVEQTVTVTAVVDSSSYENKTSTITLRSTGTTAKTITVTNVNTDVVPTLNSITARYTQGSTVIYPNTSLDTLKNNLVVTANYNNNTTATVTNYSLSGTLSVGTSTITVTYNNKTTTFNVIVTAAPTNYTITNNLTNVTNSNSATSIVEGSSYSAKVTATSGYEISSYNIIMGGTNITSTAYSDGNITISNITGNIVITVTATKQASTGGYRDVTEDDVTLINATLNIDSNGYKLTANKMWDGIRLNNIPTESKITLLQTNVGQCIWYMYKYDDNYMYVLCIGKGNGEHGKVYKMNISSNAATQDGTITMTTIPSQNDILKIVVSGTTQTLYCNDIELCTLTDCNTVGIANQQPANASYITSKWTILE